SFVPPRARLRLEALEDRYCPAAMMQVTLNSVQELANHQVQLTGHVYDDSAPVVMVNFSGVAGGSTTVLSNTDYSYITTASGLGMVMATGRDALGGISYPAQKIFTSSSPTVSLSYTLLSGHQVRLSGHVTDEAPGGLTVSLGGVAAGSAVTDPNGDFNVTLTASALGQVTATAYDQWNLSGSASATLTNAAPV